MRTKLGGIMLYGSITKDDVWYIIQVEGFPRRKYLYYSRREAVSRYRAEFNLTGSIYGLISEG